MGSKLYIDNIYNIVPLEVKSKEEIEQPREPSILKRRTLEYYDTRTNKRRNSLIELLLNYRSKR